MLYGDGSGCDSAPLGSVNVLYKSVTDIVGNTKLSGLLIHHL